MSYRKLPYLVFVHQLLQEQILIHHPDCVGHVHGVARVHDELISVHCACVDATSGGRVVDVRDVTATSVLYACGVRARALVGRGARPAVGRPGGLQSCCIIVGLESVV